MTTSRLENPIELEEAGHSLGSIDRVRPPPSSLPPFDEGLSTKRFLKIGFILSCVWSAIIMGSGCTMAVLKSFYPEFQRTWFYLPKDRFPYLGKFCTLTFTIITTVCSETLGFIHTVSLRWALAKEGRLVYNSNLRVLVTSRDSRTNGWCANCFWIFSLMLCYGGALNAVWDGEAILGCVNFSDPEHCVLSDSVFLLDMPSTLIMGLGLASLSIITGTSWLAAKRSGRIKSWNSHPLNTALACIYFGYLDHHAANALQHDTRVPTSLKPRARGLSAQQLIPLLGRIIIYLLMASLIAFALGFFTFAAVLIKYRDDLPRVSWIFFPLGRNSWIMMPGRLSFYGRTDALLLSPSWIYVMWNCAWQIFPMLTFHLAELVVNVHRDEACWRSISSPKGSKFEEITILAQFSNIGSFVLLILKPLGAWIFSLGVYTDYTDLGFNPLPLLVLWVLLTFLALVSLGLVHYRPKGPLPATYGHLQSIVNLVDDWGEGARGRLWWGDKGPSIEFMADTRVRRMGTSGNKEEIGDIQLTAMYATFSPARS